MLALPAAVPFLFFFPTWDFINLFFFGGLKCQDLAWELGRPAYAHGWMLDRLQEERTSADFPMMRCPKQSESTNVEMITD